jgi:hypothetical protein
MLGFIPVSDAFDYFGAVIDWPSEYFNLMSSRRPLNPVVQIAEFHLGGFSLLGMYVVRAVLAAIAIAAFTVSLARLIGNWAAWAAACLLMFWTWPFVSLVMTETNGITWATAGFALIFHAFAEKEKKNLLLWGLLGITIATAFRPANPFNAPVFALALVLLTPVFKKKIASGLILAALTLLVPAVAERLIFSQYGNPQTSLQGNIGQVLLGLARGTNWSEAIDYIQHLYPELVHEPGAESGIELRYHEKEINDKMLEILWPTVRENPQVLLQSLKSSFLKSVDGLFLHSLNAAGLDNLPDRFSRPAWYLFYLGLLTSMALLYRSRVVWILALSLFSLFSIAPVIYADGDWRMAATLYPGLALMGALIPMVAGKCKSWLAKEAVNTGATDAEPPGLDAAEVVRPIQLLILFALLSIPYVLVHGLLTSKDKASGNSYTFTLAIDAEKPPGWTGPNSAVISPDYMRQWFEMGAIGNYVGMKETADFIQNYRQSLHAVVLDPDEFVLVLKDSVAFKAFPAFTRPCPWCPPLKLRVQEAPK